MLVTCIESLGRCGGATPQRLSFFPFHGQTNGIQDQIYRLLRPSFVGNNAVVIQVTNHRRVQHTLLCLDVRNVGHPLGVRLFSMKLAVQQVLVLVQLLNQLIPLSAATDLCQQTIFFHNTKNCFRIVANSFTAFQPLPHSAVAVGLKAFVLLLTYLFGKFRIFLRLALTTHKAVATTPGHLKEAAHHGYGIFFPVTVYYCIFYLWPHFLPVDCRKSRSKSFSIFNRLFSFS